MAALTWPTTETEEIYWRGIQREFMIPESEVYLNTGSWGSLPRRVYETLVEKLSKLEGNPTRNRSLLIHDLEQARAALAAFVNAALQDISFLPNVTVAINMVLQGLTWQTGDEILTSDQEYGAINNAMHHTSKCSGVIIKRAPLPIPASSPSDIVEAFREHIGPRTRLILCSHIATRTGFITPVKTLSELAHERGILIAFDGAHGPGMVPLDLTDWGCDFYGGNCHKWLCAPKGTGFLYAHPKAQHLLSHTIVSWGYSQEGAVQNDKGQLAVNNRPLMWQLEHWGTRDMAPFCAVADAVAIQQKIGKDKILSRVQQLASYVREQLLARPGVKLRTPTHTQMTGAISTLFLPGLAQDTTNNQLYDKYRITTPIFQADGGIEQRISTHIYNGFSQIDTLVEAIDQLRIESGTNHKNSNS